MPRTLKICLFLFLLGTFLKGFSQITISPGTTTCMPGYIATFSYTGPPATSITWNFGSGTASGSNVQSPYISPGSYPGSCIAVVGGLPQTYTFVITVHPQPSGTFNPPVLNPSGCAPRSATFNASSNIPNATFIWGFGDNTGGNGSNIVHAYGQQGSFAPQLTIVDPNTGCDISYPSPSGTIHVSSLPNLSIAHQGVTACNAPFTTAFSASNCTSGSPLGGGLTYGWNFGNSQTSTSANSGNITYNVSGYYTVTLTATDNNNCTNSVTQLVSVITPTVSFSMPLAVCIQSQTISQPVIGTSFLGTVSSSEPSVQVDMGDGSPVFSFPYFDPVTNTTPTLTPGVPYTNVIYSYNTPGAKTVTVTATAGQCVATATQVVFVENITLSFTATPPLTSCQPSMVVTMVNQTTVNSASALSYSWEVEPWEEAPPYIQTPTPASLTSNAATPTFTLSQNVLSPYSLFGPYIPTILLTATTSPLGCVAFNTINSYTIQRPSANYSLSSTSSGCLPHTVNLISTSTTSANTTFTSYTWNSGEPVPQTINGVGPTILPASFTYTAPGVYNPTLSVTNSDGCSSISYIATITVVNPPNIGIAGISSNLVCVGVPVQVTLTSTNPQPQHWHVNSDAGFFSDCVSDPVQNWSFTSPGVHPIDISAYLNGCSTTSLAVQTITVNGPAVKARYETDCNNKLSVKFNYTLTDVATATLNFGDLANTSVPLAFAASPTVTGTHTFVYPSTGNYTATLTAANPSNGCGPQSHTMLVTVRQPSAIILSGPSNSTVFCQYETIPVILQASVVTDNLVDCTVGYAWFVNNNPVMQFDTPTLGYTFDSTGTYTVTLRVKDVNGCEDTTTRFVRVTNAAPSFTFNHNPLCFSDYPPQMINTTSQVPDAVTNFTWSFGHTGVAFPAFTQTVNNLNPLTYSNFPLSGLSQTFSVKLDAKNAFGCLDSIRQILTINNPSAILVPNGWGHLCLPHAPVTFSCYPAPPSYVNYTFDFGNLTAPVSGTNPIASPVYTATGIYTASLTITDNLGCQASDTYNFHVQVAPSAVTYTYNENGTTNPAQTVYCLPMSGISFTSTTQSNFPLYYSWNTGNGAGWLGSTSSLALGTNYVAGTQTAGLSVMTVPAGCTKISTLVLNFYDEPKAQIEINKNPFCLGELFSVTIKNPTNVAQWQWDFSDGVITPTLYPLGPTSFPYVVNTFPANSTGTFVIYLFASADPGSLCRVSPTPTIAAKVIQVIPDFKRNNELVLSDYAHCLGIADTFSNTTVSNASSLTYTWSLGDNTVSFQTSPGHVYTSPGFYSVNLIASDPNVGCTNQITKSMTVFPLPTAQLRLDVLACPDSLFQVVGSGVPGVSGALTGTLNSPQSSYSVSFDASNSFTMASSASVTSVYSLQVLDENGCKNTPVTDTIFIQEPPPSINTTTTVIIGQTVTVNGFIGNNYTYTWSPLDTNLSCTDCYNPVSTTTDNITYTVLVQDLPLGCYLKQNTHEVIIRLVASLDVPTAFTPNNDGINDIIFPGGWGIRKLNYFKVFNRWGQLLFESNDLSVGWNGLFNGVPQNMETYVYQVSVETYTNETLTKSGSFKLLR